MGKQSIVGAKENDIFCRIDSAENEIFSVTFTYLPEESDSLLIQVAGLTVTGGGVRHVPVRIKEGTNFHRYIDYAQFFKRTDPRKDISIQLDFVGRPGLTILVPALKPQDIIPVGTIVPSVLNWGEYAEAANDEEAYDPKINKWAPCDGRSILGSELAGAWGGHTKAPDLRGVFLRGLNQFDIDEEDFFPADSVSDEQKDPDSGREAGDFQGDTVGKHQHIYRGSRAAGVGRADRGDEIDNVWWGGDYGQGGERDTEKGPKRCEGGNRLSGS
uniref:Phage Tail Collar Domain n=1 Tax=Candidatus Kentrum sp. LPFa TaxID=2126335 RepID=A0A450WWT2_9GAMM|nr:MAG: hypothetical protein BECKLPF1236B_GA0070989_12553 [Candidatus Kentron sp. LPFa]